ncbi:conserved hypothetical protein [Desulfamplus magnetovallimortis]|uniref:DUF2197 domain-containing protein n=1 Tax=Desulfamplus magnetovallimortis TaxID=1246637 RepID=A0A1W1HEG6_9BACT|nr:conserved hypothetical protein [Desulfamplus magnetovallimortis]
MVYEIRCAWCGIYIGIKDGPDNRLTMTMENGECSVSHGICQTCKDKIMQDIRTNEKKKENYYEST